MQPLSEPGLTLTVLLGAACYCCAVLCRHCCGVHLQCLNKRAGRLPDPIGQGSGFQGGHSHGLRQLLRPPADNQTGGDDAQNQRCVRGNEEDTGPGRHDSGADGVTHAGLLLCCTAVHTELSCQPGPVVHAQQE